MKHRFVLVAACCAAGVLSACGDGSAGSTGGVAITATDRTCEVAKTSFEPGAVTFTVTNKGSQTTEVYIYAESKAGFTKVMAEVENVGPGLTRNLTATLTGGRYEIACKPGQTGDGIRTPITVTGPSVSAPGGAAYDREIEVEVTATGVGGADGLTARAGEKIEFKLENKATATRELKIIDPSGKIVTEIGADPNGATETVVTLGAPGTWTLKIEGDGMTEIEKKLTVS